MKEIWDEKNLIGQKNNSENKNAFGISDTMNDTAKELNKKECLNIGKQWKKNCPNCNEEIFYSDKYKLKTAILKNTKCNICWRFNKKKTNISDFNKVCSCCGYKIYYKTKYTLDSSIEIHSLCRKCSKTGINSPVKGRIQPGEEKEKRNIKLRGKVRTLESRKRYSDSKRGEKNPMFGKHISKSPVHKRKIRLGCIKNYENKLKWGAKLSPRHNPIACGIIEKYGSDNGYVFQHALNGGEFYIKELGYWVDGYDIDKNVVIEYYESFHNRTDKKMKDKNRMNEIVNYLKCKFIIIYENGGIETCI